MGTIYREIDGDSHKKVSTDKLIIGRRLPFDVFIRDKGMIVPMFPKGTLFSSISKDLLRGKGISEVFVSGQDEFELDNYLSGAPDGDKKKSFYDDPAVFSELSYQKEQHHQIDRAFLSAGLKINFSLFLLDNMNLIPLATASEKSPAVISRKVLDAKGDIVIRNSDLRLYRGLVDSVAGSSDLPGDEALKIKAFAVRENSKMIIKDLIEDPRSGENIKKSTTMVGSMAECILENRDAIYDLISLSGYDYYTYTHSVNVAVLSVGLGVAINLKREDIEKLGIGAILHDIGKSSIPHEILNKQGKLSETEYRIMKNHVIEGNNILQAHKAIPEESLVAVMQHHEKLSGKGYPFGLSAGGIKLFGRINAIADCYDALTTRRPYKPPYSPFYALSIIAKETADYDGALLKKFIKMLGKIK